MKAVPAALRKGSKRGAAEGEKGGALVHFFLRASEFVRNFESRKPRLEIRNLTPDSKLTYRRQSGCERGRRGIRGQRRAATRTGGLGRKRYLRSRGRKYSSCESQPPARSTLLAQKGSRTLLIHSRRGV